MENVDINNFKRIKQQYDEAVDAEKEMQAELKMLKTQSIEILKEYGFTSFADAPKLKQKIEEMAEEIKKAEEDMLEYIKYVNEKKANKDNILMG